MAPPDRQRWDEWLRARKADPDSAINQLQNEGLTLGEAVIVTVLGKIHEEIIDAQAPLVLPGDEWRHSDEDEDEDEG